MCPIPSKMLPLVIEWYFVGSRVTCDPPPMDTDNDVLVLCTDVCEFGHLSEGEGFTTSGGASMMDWENHEMGFISIRKDELNIIATEDEVFFRNFLKATEIAKKANILDKADRIVLFQEILYGNAVVASGDTSDPMPPSTPPKK